MYEGDIEKIDKKIELFLKTRSEFSMICQKTRSEFSKIML